MSDCDCIWRTSRKRVKAPGALDWLIAVVVGSYVMACVPGPPNDSPNRQVEEKARPSETHPFGGFWKLERCEQDFGLAIGPMGGQTYYVSFCGPGGCFAEGTYRRVTTIYGDPDYRVVDKDTLEVVGRFGAKQKYVRCAGRVTSSQVRPR